MTVARQVAELEVTDLGLRSVWSELDIRDIEEQGPWPSVCNEALGSVYDVRQIPDLEPPLIRTFRP